MQGVKDRLLYFLNPLGPPNFNSLCLLSPNRLCLELLAAKYRSTATCKNCRLYRRLQGRVFRHHCHEDRPTPYYFDAANVVYIVQYTIMCRESEDNINYTAPLAQAFFGALLYSFHFSRKTVRNCYVMGEHNEKNGGLNVARQF